MMNRHTLSALIIAISLGSGATARAQTTDLNKSTPLSSAPAASSNVERGAPYPLTTTAGTGDLGVIIGRNICANGISADGSVIVGSFIDANNVQHAYRWTKSGGAQDLGTMGGASASANGVSADGSVIVGTIGEGRYGERAVRWTQSGGVQDLGTMGGMSASANSISADGSVIVGAFEGHSNGGFFGISEFRHGFRWTESGGAQDLGDLGRGGNQLPSDISVSADGSVIVGVIVGGISDTNGKFGWRAFRWTQSGGMQDLGIMGGAWVKGVSADGSVIVGNFRDAKNYERHAFRWTQSGGTQDLGTMGGGAENVTGVSADGSVIVGFFLAPYGVLHVYRWTESGGAQDLGALSGQAALPHRVSADGSVIVGMYRDNGVAHAFRWTQSEGAQDLGTMFWQAAVDQRRF